MIRGSYQGVAKRNAFLLKRIKEIKSEHPFWGYRRIWAYLKYVDHIEVNQKRIYRLMKEHKLLVKGNTKLKAKRTSGRSKPKPTIPNQWWGIDMTKVMIDGYGWIYIVIVLDWHSKKVVGHYAGIQSKTWHWLAALNHAVNKQFPDGVRGHDLHLMSDNGCQPTSVAFMKACNAMQIKQAFTSYNNPKGNADTERFMRTMKEEFAWINEWTSPNAFCKALERWINYYNNHYLHSSLGYKTPQQEENLFNLKTERNTPLNRAC